MHKNKLKKKWKNKKNLYDKTQVQYCKFSNERSL